MEQGMNIEEVMGNVFYWGNDSTRIYRVSGIYLDKVKCIYWYWVKYNMYRCKYPTKELKNYGIKKLLVILLRKSLRK